MVGTRCGPAGAAPREVQCGVSLTRPTAEWWRGALLGTEGRKGPSFQATCLVNPQAAAPWGSSCAHGEGTDATSAVAPLCPTTSLHLLSPSTLCLTSTTHIRLQGVGYCLAIWGHRHPWSYEHRHRGLPFKRIKTDSPSWSDLKSSSPFVTCSLFSLEIL